jgi:hypothetical protein
MEPETLEPYGPGHGVAHAIRRLEDTKSHAEWDLREWNSPKPAHVIEEATARLAGIKLAIRALEELQARMQEEDAR